MTQTVPETAKTNNQPTPETIETNGLGVPSSGHNEPISTEEAVAQTVELVEEETGAVDGATQELTTDPNITQATPSAEHAEVDLHEEVAAAGVTHTNPATEAEIIDQDARNLGVQIVGEEAPTRGLGETQGEFNPQPATPKPENPGFPPVMQTGILGDPEKNGEPLHKLAMKRLGELKRFILAGTKATENPAPELNTNVPHFAAQKERTDIPKPA